MKRVGTTCGMRGYFAVLYDNDGPIQTGIGSYTSPEGAEDEARDWARSEGLPCDHAWPEPEEKLSRIIMR